MKKEEMVHHKFESISDAHRAFGLLKPLHPLISLINGTKYETGINQLSGTHVLSFYKISYKTGMGGKLKYGQHYYDFDEGGLLFASPNQLIGGPGDEGESVNDCSSYTLLIHPDFFLGHSLAKTIKQHGFFSYAIREALHMSDTEKETIITLFKIIEDELGSRIDEFSQSVVLSQVELLLTYANRFYRRQFMTRKAVNSNLLQKLEEITDDYFGSETSLRQGVPSVQYLAEQLHLSPGYLSDMLRLMTGQNAQQYIHNKLIEKAKEKLSATSLSVSEVAYELGFEHPQSFSKLFKTKTHLSPLEFRRSFN